jgi:diguanylate cyclase (GGDEF)-like protein
LGKGLVKAMDDLLVKCGLISGDVPTTDELEWLKESRERVGMVIRARWAILAILAGYAVYAFFFYRHETADALRVKPLHQAVAVGAFLFAVAYNAWYRYTYQWFSRIRQLNQAQLLFDLVFVTVIVHFSGGAVSWFWAMYMILTLEAALIMDKPSDTYAIALAGVLAFGGLLTFEFYELIPPVPMPFENNALQKNFSYGMIKWAWVSIVNFCVAFVGVHMMDTVRRREAELRDLVTKDALTSFYNRRYFFHRLNSEIQRAKRYGRTLSLLILDVDNFKRFNDTYGHLEGDALLRGLADVIRGTIRRSDAKPSYEVDIACRYGGEEFAVILPEAAQVQGGEAAERLRASIEAGGAGIVAERIRHRIETTPLEGKTVTVSIGVSSYPEHGEDVEMMIRAADEAMYTAKRAGKNRVAISGNG